MELSAPVLLAVQFRFKLVGKEGHYILESERVFRPHLPSHCSGVTEIRHMALPAHELCVVQVSFKTVFSSWDRNGFSSISPSHCSGVTSMYHVALAARS
jgi:hypothetical protein